MVYSPRVRCQTQLKDSLARSQNNPGRVLLRQGKPLSLRATGRLNREGEPGRDERVGIGDRT